MHNTNVVKKPIISEKSLARLGDSQYSFTVDPRASKYDVARAVEELFNVTVLGVKTMNRKGKTKRVFRKRHTTTMPTRKVAIVSIDPKQKIELFTEFDGSAAEATEETK